MFINLVYNWLTENIAYFRTAPNPDRWKNSVRHNLSLHDRFVHAAHADAGKKSTWWTLRPESTWRARGQHRVQRLQRKNTAPESLEMDIERPPTPPRRKALSASSRLQGAQHHGPVTLMDDTAQSPTNIRAVE